MIKTVTLLAKRDDWTREDFLKYWREIHGPLANDVKNIHRYVQSECLDNIVRKDVVEMDIVIDGIAEVWYESEAAMREARASPEGQRLLADGAKFIGRARTVVVQEDEFISRETA